MGHRFKIAVRQNATGVVRLYDMGPDIGWDGGTVYWLTDGNYGCDCNREQSFRRAGGEPDGETSCGDDRYSIPYVVLDDGEKIAIEGPLPVD